MGGSRSARSRTTSIGKHVPGGPCAGGAPELACCPVRRPSGLYRSVSPVSATRYSFVAASYDTVYDVG